MLEPLMLRGILFDFHGTLVDLQTDEHQLAPWRVLTSWLDYRGATFDAQVLQAMYLASVQRSLDHSAEAYPDVDVEAVFAELLRSGGGDAADARAAAQLLRSRTITRWHVFEESLEVVSALASRYPLALVSDSQEPYLLPELRRSGLAEHFKAVVVSSRYGYRKPDPRLFQRALAQLGIAAADAVYIGDSRERDVAGAASAGIRPILVARYDGHAGADGVKVLRNLRGLLRFAQ
jgi:putative hydrolase of the HAD superfamily